MKSQLLIHKVGENSQVYLNLPIFKKPKKLGKVDKIKSTFRTVKRTSKNLFRKFNGLGINAELLRNGHFKFIECNYEGIVLKTTREHFLKYAKESIYCNDKVDLQLILPLDQWIIPETEQFDLF